MSAYRSCALEEHCLTPEEVVEGITLEKVLLRRHPNGSWALSGTMHITHALDEGRRFACARPFHVRFLTEETVGH